MPHVVGEAINRRAAQTQSLSGGVVLHMGLPIRRQRMSAGPPFWMPLVFFLTFFTTFIGRKRSKRRRYKRRFWCVRWISAGFRWISACFPLTFSVVSAQFFHPFVRWMSAGHCGHFHPLNSRDQGVTLQPGSHQLSEDGSNHHPSPFCIFAVSSGISVERFGSLAARPSMVRQACMMVV
jgi:hypothetical protein